MTDCKPMDRNIYLDNAKGLLMLLVVVGHIIAPVRSASGVNKALYIFIYSFHMPVFAFLSGYFTSPDMSFKSYKKSILRLLPPYLIFQSIYILLEGSFAHAAWHRFSLFEPFNAMWYLISLLTWRALLPLFSMFRYPILISLILSLLCGYFPSVDRYFSLSRTCVLLPFFLMGFRFRQKNAGRLSGMMPKSIGAALLVLGGLLALYYRWIDLRWLWHADGYALMGYQGWLGAVFRLLTLSVAGILGLAFFSVVPESETTVSRTGRQTLYVYLLHFLAIRILLHLGFYAKMTSIAALAILVSLGIFMGVVLSHDRVVKTTAVFIDPISVWTKQHHR